MTRVTESSGRFVRAILVRTLVVVVPLWVVVALVGPPSWLLILGAVSVAVIVIDILWLGYRVARDQRRAGAAGWHEVEPVRL